MLLLKIYRWFDKDYMIIFLSFLVTLHTLEPKGCRKKYTVFDLRFNQCKEILFRSVYVI